MTYETPSYIKALLKPNGGQPRGRKLWSIDLEAIWLPFFTATNAMGDTLIPADALGAPLRLAHDRDGSIKFSASGRPVVKVTKDVQESVRLVRDRFVAGLMDYANAVARENTKGYKAQVEASQRAGLPIIQKDINDLTEYMALLEAACAAAQAVETRQPQEVAA